MQLIDPKKLILVDADGVLLNWEYAFQVWMESQGYIFRNHANKIYDIGAQYQIPREEAVKLIKQFNESAAIGFIPPLRDAMYYVKRLHEEHGYQFHVISSLSTDINAKKLRVMNLQKLFGASAFADVTCLATGADKHEALEPYRDSGLWWIEDKYENFKLGVDIGLNGILFEHGHNMYEDSSIGHRATTWKEVYSIITS